MSFEGAQGAGTCPMVGAQKRPASSLPLQEMVEEGALYTLELAAEDALEQPGGVRLHCSLQLARLTPCLMQGSLETSAGPTGGLLS